MVARAPRTPDLAKRWLTFVRIHREAIAAMDFFTVPTLTFGVLCCFFVIGPAREMGSQPMRTAFRSPWQNGVAERWVGSCRRDLLDHVIVLNERHLKRLMAEYMRYYPAHRTHLGLTKDTPAGRPIAIRPQGKGTIRWVPSTRWATPSLCGVDQRLSSRRTPRLPVHSSTRIKSHVENSYRLSNAGGLLLVCLSTEGYDELQGFIL
jgi:hypothetical protein